VPNVALRGGGVTWPRVVRDRIRILASPSAGRGDRAVRDNRVMAVIDRFLGRPPSTRHADVDPAPNPGVVVYWRDGCPFTMRLRHAVRGYADRAAWVDIWDDPDAAAFVRSTNAGGHETVPTVVIDGVAHTNPDPALVLEALRREPPPGATARD